MVALLVTVSTHSCVALWNYEVGCPFLNLNDLSFVLFRFSSHHLRLQVHVLQAVFDANWIHFSLPCSCPPVNHVAAVPLIDGDFPAHCLIKVYILGLIKSCQ